MTQVVMVREDGRKRVRTLFEDESLTVQSDVARSEMKHILAKYEETGVLVGLRDVDLAYRDVSEFGSYGDLVREHHKAKEAFMALPSKVREVFGHSVENWLDAAHRGLDEDQTAKLVDLGVLEAVEEPPVVAPAAITPSEGEAPGATP